MLKNITYTFTFMYTAWGNQLWSAFCGPSAATIGGCERKDEQNLLDSSLSNGVNVVAKAGSRQSPYIIACQQLMAQSSAQNKPYEDLRRPQYQQEPCFHDEKAPRCWPEPHAMAKGQKEGMGGDLGAETWFPPANG